MLIVTVLWLPYILVTVCTDIVTGIELHTVTVLWLPYILVTVCTDIVTGIELHTVTVLWLPYILVTVCSLFVRTAVGNSRKTEAPSIYLFKHYVTKAYRDSNTQLHTFLTSALHQLHVPTVLSRNKNHQQPIHSRSGRWQHTGTECCSTPRHIAQLCTAKHHFPVSDA